MLLKRKLATEHTEATEYKNCSSSLCPLCSLWLKHAESKITKQNFSAVAGADGSPGDQVNVVGDRAQGAVAKEDIDDAGMQTRRRDLHGHVGHVAGKADTGARSSIGCCHVVVRGAAHFTHDPACSLFAGQGNRGGWIERVARLIGGV